MPDRSGHRGPTLLRGSLLAHAGMIEDALVWFDMDTLRKRGILFAAEHDVDEGTTTYVAFVRGQRVPLVTGTVTVSGSTMRFAVERNPRAADEIAALLELAEDTCG